MRKNGFTLIELLAVIVILAIIALIATPIILGIINDARKESNERSAELYASSVKNAIASYQLTHPTAPTKFSDLNVQYDGDVECAKEELYSDGNFYIAECTVNGDEVDYTYGEQQVTQVYKPQYYWFDWDSGSIGGALPSDAKTTVEELNSNHLYYLGFDVDKNNKIIAAYLCFARRGAEYCLKGGDEGESYNTNKTILEEAFGESACSFFTPEESENLLYECNADSVYATMYVGMSAVSADGDATDCYVDNKGAFGCGV